MNMKTFAAALIPCCLLTACYTPGPPRMYQAPDPTQAASLTIKEPFAPNRYESISVSRRELKCDVNNAVVDPAPYSGELADFRKTKDSDRKNGVHTVTVKVAPGYAKYAFGMLHSDRSCGNEVWANLQAGRAYEMTMKWVYEGSWPLTKQSCTVAITDLQSGAPLPLSRFDDPPEANDTRCVAGSAPQQGAPMLTRGAPPR